jgi:hypothetical protein
MMSTGPLSRSEGNRAGPIGFFQAVQQTFERAERAAEDPIDRFYTIAGHVVRLRFAGSVLVPLITPALEHLAMRASSAPALTICLWDSDSTGLEKPPRPPWSWDECVARGEVHRYNDDRIQTAFHASTLSMLDMKLNLGIYWVRDANHLTYTESGSPLLRIFHWWMRNHGSQLVHAGAVGTAEGGALLIGKGGSGKSTTCLLCLDSALLYLGDDYCLISTDPLPYAHSLYSSGKVDAQDISRFTFLKSGLSNADRLDSEKALYFLSASFPEKISNGFPLRAILLPRVSGLPETKLKKVSASASLLASAPSTIFQLPGAGHQAFRVLGDLVRQVPSYILEVGTDLSQIPGTILNLLSEL